MVIQIDTSEIHEIGRTNMKTSDNTKYIYEKKVLRLPPQMHQKDNLHLINLKDLMEDLVFKINLLEIGKSI